MWCFRTFLFQLHDQVPSNCYTGKQTTSVENIYFTSTTALSKQTTTEEGVYDALYLDEETKSKRNIEEGDYDSLDIEEDYKSQENIESKEGSQSSKSCGRLKTCIMPTLFK